MRSRMGKWLAIAAVVTLSIAGRGGAQTESPPHSRYLVVDTGTLGGPNSTFQGFFKVINARGIAVTAADTAEPDPNTPCFNPNGGTDCFVRHAGLWNHRKLVDLGTLTGGYFSQGIWLAENGLIASGSDIGIPDPLTGQQLQLRAVVWRHGSIINLGTLGGNESVAASVNSRGQVVGCALNEIPDTFSSPFAEFVGAFKAATQTRAFIWKNGRMQDLGTLGGPDACATYMNEYGQVAGFSYINSTPDPNFGIPAMHPFFWDRGRMTDLGTFGGVFTLPFALNNRGFLNTAGDRAQHPFLWERGRLTDLGTLGGDNGEARWINDEGVAVGNADLPGSTVTSLSWAFQRD
jgi:probable HAF family extracellular repeat protein